MMMHRMMPDLLPPGVTPEDLPHPDSPGAKLLVQYCGHCHNLPSPAMHSAREWPAVAERMFYRMRMMGGMMGVGLPSPEEQSVLVDYLKANALKSIESSALPSATTAEAGDFRRFCTQCHAPPDPRSHTAADWPAVVDRMKSHMQTMNKKVPSAGQEKQILAYLEKNALRR
jgi:cytochrome c5